MYPCTDHLSFAIFHPEAIVIFVSCGVLGHPRRVETMADGKTLEVARDTQRTQRGWGAVGFS
jgi:hypothetical protein